jgi:hypothetical protein
VLLVFLQLVLEIFKLSDLIFFDLSICNSEVKYLTFH